MHLVRFSLWSLRSDSTISWNSSGSTYGIMFEPMRTNFTLSRNSSTVEPNDSTGTSLALMIFAALWSSSPEADGITNNVCTPL